MKPLGTIAPGNYALKVRDAILAASPARETNNDRHPDVSLLATFFAPLARLAAINNVNQRTCFTTGIVRRIQSRLPSTVRCILPETFFADDVPLDLGCIASRHLDLRG